MFTSSSSSSASRSSTSPAERLARAWRRGSAPPPRISIPEWADRYRKLAKEAGSTSGAWRTSTVEIARGPMLAATEPGVHVITAMVATQLLKTSLLENTFGFFAHLDPCPMMLVQPKEAAALQFSKERISPLVRATPALRELIGTRKTRSAEETLDFKAFPGGFLALVGAGSPDNLARRPVRVVMYDEVDKYPVTREGDPIALGDERMATFVSWLSIRVCSPTVEEESRIEESFLDGDQRRASLACPHCGHRQFPRFHSHVEWDKEGEGAKRRHLWRTAHLVCEHTLCRRPWSDGDRIRALRSIRWHQTRTFECCDVRQDPLELYAQAWREHGLVDPVDEVWDWWEETPPPAARRAPRWAVYRARCSCCRAWPISNEHASFTAGKLYSPWPKDNPAAQADKWLKAQGNEHALQVWWNTQQATPYRRNVGRALKPDALAARGETWAAAVPDGVALITAGVDIQDYRIEVELVGWGRNEESWSIDTHVIDGEFADGAVQKLLDEHLAKVWTRADGRGFEVAATCIDSGGHHTEAVYKYAQARLGRRVWAIKGESAINGRRNPVWPVKRPTSRTKKAFRPVIIGVNAAKDEIASRLRVERPGPRYMHFPGDRDLAYFAQLTSERSVTKVAPNGLKYRVWELPPGRANEALDMRVYAYAALCGLQHVTSVRLNRRADEVGAAVTPVLVAPVARIAPAAEAAGNAALAEERAAAAPPPPRAPLAPVVVASKPSAASPAQDRAKRLAQRLARRT